MSILPTRFRLIAGVTLCVGLALPALGFGTAIAQASRPPAPIDDPAPPPAPQAPDPSTIVNQANTILPMITQFAQILPAFMDPTAALQGPTDTSVLQQPPMLGSLMPGA